MQKEYLLIDMLGQYVALEVKWIQRLVRAVEVTKIFKASPLLYGVIDMHGELLPVFDLHQLLGLESREIALNDVMVVVQCKTMRVVLLCEGVEGVFLCEESRELEEEASFFPLQNTTLIHFRDSLVPVLNFQTIFENRLEELDVSTLKEAFIDE